MSKLITGGAIRLSRDIRSERWALFALSFFLVLVRGGLAGADQDRRRTVDLRDGWLVKQLETDRPDVASLARELARPDRSWLSARMPAQVHDVLLAHGLIPDPRIGKNAADSAWVGEKDWAYACRFPSPGHEGPVFLRFEGLDTIATAFLNGAEIGRFEDMFIEYEIEVSRNLSPAGKENLLLLVFSSPLRYAETKGKSRPSKERQIGSSKFIRKSSGDFGSYLGARPHMVKVGVYRGISLDVPGAAWIEDVWVRPEVTPDFKAATVRTEISVLGKTSPLRWALDDPAGRTVASGESRASTAHSIRIEVKEPKLWWPWTHGDPSLYRLRTELLDGQTILDARSVEFGFRDIRIVRRDPATGEPRFRFDVNGRPVFLMGANWIPVEGVSHVWDSGRARTLLDLTQNGRMNVLRVWGEGYIPPPEFYEECDRRGILVWQDFMFGYGPYPTGVAGLDELYRSEVEFIVKKLRNHPSLFLWVGGNENHMGWDFAGQKPPMPGLDLFDKVIPEICARLDPTRNYHPSSPYGGPSPNWPLEGDWHDYTTLTFSPEASVPAFGSEVGRASVPSLQTMKRILGEDDLWPKGFDPRILAPGRPAWPPMWQYRSVNGSWDKVGPLELYCDPASAGDLIRVLGTAHGEYLRDRVERERRGAPDGAPPGPRRCWGNIVWRLNDCLPIIYWSVIDYFLEPKIAYYYLRRAYEPVQVSFEKTEDRIAAWVVNDSPRHVRGELCVERMTFEGKTMGKTAVQVSVAPGEAKRVIDLNELGPIPLREEFLRAELEGRETTALVFAEKYLHLPEARLSARLVGDAVELSADRFVRQVELTMDNVSGAAFEDDYFDLAPGSRRTVKILNSAGGSTLIVKGLNAGSLSLDVSSGSKKRP